LILFFFLALMLLEDVLDFRVEGIQTIINSGQRLVRLKGREARLLPNKGLFWLRIAK
jgi:hypothetical protein